MGQTPFKVCTAVKTKSFFFEEVKMKYITTSKRYSRHKVYQGNTVRSEQ